MKTPSKITQMDTLKGIRKTMPRPSFSFKDKAKYRRAQNKLIEREGRNRALSLLDNGVPIW